MCILAGVIEDEDDDNDVEVNHDQNDADNFSVNRSNVVDQASDMKDDAICCFKSHTGPLSGTMWL